LKSLVYKPRDTLFLSTELGTAVALAAVSRLHDRILRNYIPKFIAGVLSYR